MMLSDEERKDAQLKIVKLCVLRTEGLSEDEIAERLEFTAELGATAAQRMYARLLDLRLPPWLVYPEGAPMQGEPGLTGGDEGDNKSASEPDRKARAAGEPIELPPAERAVDLLRGELRRSARLGDPDQWRGSLEEDLEELFRLKEWLRGDHFVSVLYDEFDREIYRREELSEEVWLSLCEAEGLDPETAEAVEGPTTRLPLGASPTPWPGWVRLLAVYALRNPSVKPLVEALHPDPSSVDVENLYKKRGVEGAKYDGTVTELRNAAERLAKVVRGWKVRRGAPPPGVSRHDLWVKWQVIDPLRRKGCSYEEIFEEMKAQGYPIHHILTMEGTPFTVEKIRRLGGLNLSPPDEAK
ncbi:MAG: hypothetical protein AVDCRST_MAG05-4623 [uncultured Rubrobacteraceae bacterium]|uniref:Uncharacterized protein n=1 Tax=uncultured Rubrobacteraceae bacterium TaxID=349277 RepID=A0A6J4TV93_9ACTN|nr:MAG: hypothetical protein AVDCRST_MAG05-4623 [uncultured Rubrobacteraceae bacterium]